MKPRLELVEKLPAELVHYASSDGRVTSRANVVTCERPGVPSATFRFPVAGWRRLALPWRLLRRLLRLDKAVVVPVRGPSGWDALVVVRAGHAYHVDLQTGEVRVTLTLRQSRNPLHQSVCRSGRGWFYQGEYGANPDRSSVPIHRSTDAGRSWHTVFEIPAGRARHVHGCFWDPFEERVWVCTGDFAGENHLLVADEAFEEVEWIGDGGQMWRTCHLFFTAEAVFWGMDSQLEASSVCRLRRPDRSVQRVFDLPGPAWYGKHLTDGWMVVGTAVEKGPSVRSDHAHVFASRDGDQWLEVFSAKKDGWRMPLFKNGVINFADGEQDAAAIHLSAEALVGMDGRTFRASLVR